jgi:hypothetical protein
VGGIKEFFETLERYWGQRFIDEVLKFQLQHGGTHFIVFHLYYWQGGERVGYREILQECYKTATSMEDLLTKFKEGCRNRGVTLNQRAYDIARFSWVLHQKAGDALKTTVEMIKQDPLKAWLYYTRQNGIGPKIASFTLCDACLVSDAYPSEHILPLYIPIDVWIRTIAKTLFEIDLDDPWLAIAFTDICKKYNVEPLKTQAGAWTYGATVVKRTQDFEDHWRGGTWRIKR